VIDVMQAILPRLILGLALSTVIGLLAYRRRSLSGSGVAGAVLIGTTIFGFGGWVWGGVLVAFFVSSSVLSHYNANRKAALAEHFAKDGRRDFAQTLANGGLAALMALVAGLLGRTAPLFPVLAMAFYGALATANADTWATELGVLAKRLPRLISTGRAVPTGTSGGVTGLGLVAALAGAAFIGLVAFILVQGAAQATLGAWLLQDWVLIPVAAISGLGGALFDSLLGATVQSIYFCDACGRETEQAIHRCGHPAHLLRGWRWLGNDWVNFLASIFGAALAATMGLFLF
jgi:uncharacterized protein (TIGR00297 family)